MTAENLEMSQILWSIIQNIQRYRAVKALKKNFDISPLRRILLTSITCSSYAYKGFHK
jgi:hypothetical protein